METHWMVTGSLPDQVAHCSMACASSSQVRFCCGQEKFLFSVIKVLDDCLHTDLQPGVAEGAQRTDYFMKVVQDLRGSMHSHANKIVGHTVRLTIFWALPKGEYCCLFQANKTSRLCSIYTVPLYRSVAQAFAEVTVL